MNQGLALMKTTCWPAEPTAMTVPRDPTVAELILVSEVLPSDCVGCQVAPVPLLA